MCVYEDVQVDGGLNPPGSSGKRHSKMTLSCPNQKEHLWWYGHVVGSEENSVSRTALRLDPVGR